MTVAEVGASYGLSDAEYSSMESYFEADGFSVYHSWADRLSLTLSGPTSAVDRAFGTTLLTGSYLGRPVTFPSTAPSLPPDLESRVAAVTGLISGFDRFSLPTIAGPTPSTNALSPAINPTDLITPAIARDIYGVSNLYNLTSTTSPTYASGKGIVLLLWGDGYSPSDIQTFFSADYPAAFPAPDVVPYPVDGAPSPSPSAPNDPSNGSRELTLDIEWSGSMAPGATLDAVYAPAGPASAGYSPTDASMIDALNLAVDSSQLPGVAAISMSFGSADGADATLTTGFETDFSVAAKEHISVFAATGDLGGDAAPGCSGGLQPDYPSASPQVVAVGGTSVTLDRNLLGAVTGFSETAWDQSGGGFSSQFAAPSWQEVGSAAAPIKANGHRGMPDVSATAGYNFLYFNGGPAAGGGTSFATPLWAGMITEMDALRGSNFGFVTPSLYGLGAAGSTTHPSYNDVTSGGNCVGSAKVGWDVATGWGSPVAINLYVHLVGSFVNISIGATPTPVAPGGAVTIVVNVTNATSGAPLSATPVVVSLGSTGLGGPCSGTFGSVTPTSNGTGTVVATISVPVCYLGSSAAVTVNVDSNGHYGQASSSVNVNLLGFVPALAPLSEYPDNVVFFVIIMALAIALGGVFGRQRPGAPAVVVAPTDVPPPPPATPPENPQSPADAPPTPPAAS
jgi:subtilase family serine protease